MGKEDQVEEREVLDSIFPEEITSFGEDHFQISLILDTVNDDGDESEQPVIVMSIKYPEDYPDVAPEIDLSSPPNASSHTYFDLSSDKEQLLESLSSTMTDNLGMAMVFTLYSTLKDIAEQLIIDRQQAARKEQEQRLMKAEEEENKRFQGPAVTPESFMKWRNEFRQEMDEKKKQEETEEEEKEKKKNKGKEVVNKLTGRQLFEGGLAGKVDEDDDGEDALAGGIDKLKVSS